MIHCCTCDAKVDARLTDGKEIYPHRPDLGRPDPAAAPELLQMILQMQKRGAGNGE